MNPILIKKTQSTFLIPKRLLNDFQKKAREYTSREFYLHSLIKRYKPFVLEGFFGNKSKVKTAYQNPDENLIRQNLRPMNLDWLELGMLADFVGVSKCALFVIANSGNNLPPVPVITCQ